MLVNISYNNPELESEIDQLVGKSFSLWDRIKMRGTGSSKFSIIKCSGDILNLLKRDNNSNVCNIEIRPKGIIIHFRAKLETYGVIIPFYRLTLYKSKDTYSIYGEEHKIILHSSQPSQSVFFQKIQELKSNFQENQSLPH